MSIINKLFIDWQAQLSPAYNSRIMSYGWLTESTLMPKKSKPIVVEDEGSLFSLRAVVLRQKERVQEGGQNRPIFQISRKNNRNQGIEQRNKRDLECEQAAKVRESRSFVNKQKVYQALQARRHNIDTLLVDFAGKALEQEDEEFKAKRENFYSGRIEQIRQQRQEISSEGQGEKDLRQRLAWERQVLGALKGEAQEKEKVQQVFDHRLNQEEKEALGAVLRERSQEEEHLIEVKKRRVDLQQQRIRKLQRLSVLSAAQKQIKECQEEQPKGGQLGATFDYQSLSD